MEVTITDHENFAEGSILSIRFGSTRRQAPLESVKAHPLKFPCRLDACCEPLKIDVLQPTATSRLVLHSYEESYVIGLQGNDGRILKVDLTARNLDGVTESSAKGSSRRTADGGLLGRMRGEETSASATAAREYLDSTGLLRYVQALLHAIIQAKPADPYAFMMKQLSAAQSRNMMPMSPSAKDDRLFGGVEEAIKKSPPPVERDGRTGGAEEARSARASKQSSRKSLSFVAEPQEAVAASSKPGFAPDITTASGQAMSGDHAVPRKEEAPPAPAEETPAPAPPEDVPAPAGETAELPALAAPKLPPPGPVASADDMPAPKVAAAAVPEAPADGEAEGPPPAAEAAVAGGGEDTPAALPAAMREASEVETAAPGIGAALPEEASMQPRLALSKSMDQLRTLAFRELEAACIDGRLQAAFSKVQGSPLDVPVAATTDIPQESPEPSGALSADAIEVSQEKTDLRSAIFNTLKEGSRSGRLTVMLETVTKDRAQAKVEEGGDESEEDDAALRAMALTTLKEGTKTGELTKMLDEACQTRQKPEEAEREEEDEEDEEGLRQLTFQTLAQGAATGGIDEALAAARQATDDEKEDELRGLASRTLQTGTESGRISDVLGEVRAEKGRAEDENLRKQALSTLQSGTDSGKLGQILGQISQEKEENELRGMAYKTLKEAAVTGQLTQSLEKHRLAQGVKALAFDVLGSAASDGRLEQALQRLHHGTGSPADASPAESLAEPGDDADKELKAKARETLGIAAGDGRLLEALGPPRPAGKASSEAAESKLSGASQSSLSQIKERLRGHLVCAYNAGSLESIVGNVYPQAQATAAVGEHHDPPGLKAQVRSRLESACTSGKLEESLAKACSRSVSRPATAEDPAQADGQVINVLAEALGEHVTPEEDGPFAQALLEVGMGVSAGDAEAEAEAPPAAPAPVGKPMLDNEARPEEGEEQKATLPASHPIVTESTPDMAAVEEGAEMAQPDPAADEAAADESVWRKREFYMQIKQMAEENAELSVSVSALAVQMQELRRTNQMLVDQIQSRSPSLSPANSTMH